MFVPSPQHLSIEFQIQSLTNQEEFCPTFVLCGVAEPLELEFTINNNDGYKETRLALCGIPVFECAHDPSRARQERQSRPIFG